MHCMIVGPLLWWLLHGYFALNYSESLYSLFMQYLMKHSMTVVTITRPILCACMLELAAASIMVVSQLTFPHKRPSLHLNTICQVFEAHLQRCITLPRIVLCGCMQTCTCKKTPRAAKNAIVKSHPYCVHNRFIVSPLCLIHPSSCKGDKCL
jgi:hypothetical protein